MPGANSNLLKKRLKTMKKIMKSFAELTKIATDAMMSTIQYEVETDADKDGGWYFSKLSDAYLYLSNTLRKQIDIELFECDDFDKIDYIRLSIHFIDKPTEILPLVHYTRKSDTEFIETELF